MLKEKIVYRNELPINVITANISEYPIHFHDDMEVVYVLEGSIMLRNGCYTYRLKQGEIYIINDREMHSLENTGEDNMVMMLQMDLIYFSRYYDNLKNNFFATDMDDDSDESLDGLRSILARIMMEILQKGYGYEHKVIESTHNLIACLMSDFQYFVMDDGKFRNELNNKSNKILSGRLNRITDYMYDNYERKLTLSEIAEREHLSIYYLSHIIKEATGLSFQDLLSYIRVEESEKLLLGSNKRIGVIASETGFSAVRYYIKHFEHWYGMHPLDYRQKYMGKIISREIAAKYTRSTPVQIEEAIRKQVKGVYADYADKLSAKPVIIDIDTDSDYEDLRYQKTRIDEIMSRDVNRILAVNYSKFTEINERVICKGDNYVVSTPCKLSESIDRLTVIVYNFDESTGNALKRISSERELLNVIRSYDAQMEFLIRCSGLTGTFRVSRCKLDKENLIRQVEMYLDELEWKGGREGYYKTLSSMPQTSIGDYSSADVHSVRTTFTGVGTEIILIDRISE